MEWAAGEQHAQIVNMSLGSPEAGGPLTEALSTLTREYGTLFVVAAGNDGCESCVGSPGDAPRGADRRRRGQAGQAGPPFSSRGPITATQAVKPEVTAPGVDITAARTGGGLVSMSGTSMATPHVAGAAALLRQARPGLTGGELKALLTATAKPGQDIPVDAQGLGRIDVNAALRSTVVASTGTLDFGRNDEGAAKTLTIGYRNLGDQPADLDLSAGDAFTVEPARLTVPAGGTAQAKVTLKADRPGVLRQELVAGGARTLLTGSVEEEKVELRVRGIARDGRTARGGFTVLNLDEGTLVGRVLPGDPAQPCTDAKYGSGTCLLVKPGTYSVLGHIFTMPATQDSTATGDPLNESLVGDPEMKITKDTEVVLDARKAVEVKVETPDHETKRNTGAAAAIKWYRAGEQGTALRGGTTITPGGQIEERLFIQPTRKVTKGTFVVATRWRLTAPEITFSTLGLKLDPPSTSTPSSSATTPPSTPGSTAPACSSPWTPGAAPPPRSRPATCAASSPSSAAPTACRSPRRPTPPPRPAPRWSPSTATGPAPTPPPAATASSWPSRPCGSPTRRGWSSSSGRATFPS
ncbi:hypothetical protein GCM10020001_009580 [Nonomuraea salmonea]